MEYQEAYLVYDNNDNIIGIALSQAEAAFQVWEEFTAEVDEMDAREMYLKDFGYDSWEDFEEDWYAGGHGWEIDGFYYEEYPVLD